MAKNLNEHIIPRNKLENLRRLIYFHHESAREAAAVIGVTEQAISGWLRGKRDQSMPVLMRMAEIYDVDPRVLIADPVEFAQVLADPDRMRRAEENIERIKHGKAPAKQKPKATVTKLQSRRKG